MQIEVDGTDIHFTVFGNGPPLVILHGWGDSSDSWFWVVDILQYHYQVFVLDLPGFGASTPLASVWSVEQYCSVVMSFLDEMGLDAPVILGHSLGGKIACLVAEKKPSISGLILVAASGVDRPSFTVKAKVRFFKACKFFLHKCGHWGERRVAGLRKMLGSTDYQNAGQAENPCLQPTLVSVVNRKLFELLPQLAMPSLVIWGSSDQTLSVKQAKLFRQLLPDAYIRIVWEAGHHPQVDDPAMLAQYIIDFKRVVPHAPL